MSSLYLNLASLGTHTLTSAPAKLTLMHGRLLLKTAIDSEGQCLWVWQGQKKEFTTLGTEKTTVKIKFATQQILIIVLPLSTEQQRWSF